jgi:glycerol-3-phosphate acyltransferase PlsX
MPTVIAVDAMGTDRAPKPEVEGAILAARYFNVHVILVGRESAIRAELRQHPTAQDLPIRVVNATEIIGMDEQGVAQSVRTKKDSSIRVGLRLVREGEATGFVSAGNTGAVMATAKMVLGALPGVDRPALAGPFPTSAGTVSVMLDVGANVDCKPHNLEQFAVMGEVYYRTIFNHGRPRVGILSIGEEESHGNQLTKEATPLLRQLPIHFVGNVEGRDLYNGKVEVIVADGFIGNVALKVSEGLVLAVSSLLKESLKATLTRQMGYLLSRQAFKEFKKRMDYTEYGGAPLLGVKGVVIVGHGSSNANAIKNAVRVAAEMVRGDVNDKIAREIAAAHQARAATVES